VKKMSSRIANRVRNFFTHDGVHDTGCPLKIFRRLVLERLRLFEGMHRFFPALALMHGFTVTEVPVRHYPRIHGVSKYGMGNRLFTSLYDLIAVLKRYHIYHSWAASRSERPVEFQFGLKVGGRSLG
jgi:hypothetical protein